MPGGTMIVSPCLATRSSPSRVECAARIPVWYAPSAPAVSAPASPNPASVLTGQQA
jgi:hypothetical protein